MICGVARARTLSGPPIRDTMTWSFPKHPLLSVIVSVKVVIVNRLVVVGVSVVSPEAISDKGTHEYNKLPVPPLPVPDREVLVP